MKKHTTYNLQHLKVASSLNVNIPAIFGASARDVVGQRWARSFFGIDKTGKNLERVKCLEPHAGITSRFVNLHIRLLRKTCSKIQAE